jgi:uncharacterized spore protein YtfJ
MSSKSTQQTPPTVENDLIETLDVIQNSMYRLLDAAHVNAVYGEAVQNGDTTVIPCAEVLSGGVFGLGGGRGVQGAPETGDDENEPSETALPKQAGMGGWGGGGGWGGRSFSRPVAVVVASPEGVHVEPIIDVSKIALAALTAFGFMFGMLARMNRPKNED